RRPAGRTAGRPDGRMLTPGCVTTDGPAVQAARRPPYAFAGAPVGRHARSRAHASRPRPPVTVAVGRSAFGSEHGSGSATGGPVAGQTVSPPRPHAGSAPEVRSR